MRTFPVSPRFRLIEALLIGAACSSPALATDFLWTGTTNNTWATGTNWSTGTAPNGATAAVFFGTATNRLPNLAATASVGSLTFNVGGDAFTISRTVGTFSLASGGSVVNNSSNLQTISAPMTLSGSTTWSSVNGDLLVSGVLSGASGSLTKDGTGVLTLAGANTYSGTTTISAGTLQVGNAGTTGALGAGAVTNNSILSFNRSNALSVSNAIGGTGSIKQIGAGTTTLTGANTYSGGTLISSGTLAVGTNGKLGTGGVTNNSILGYSGTGIITEANVISGTGSVSQSGTGTTILTATNTYSGGTAITAGAVQFTTADNFGTGTVTLNGGALRWASGNTLDLSNRISLGASGGILDTNGNNVSLGSALGGSGGLTKTGDGILTLNAAPTSATSITVSGGTLRPGAASILPAGVAYTVLGTTANGTATLDLNGIDLSVSSLTFGGTVGKLNVVNTVATGAATLTLGGAVTYTNSTGNANHAGTAAITGKLDLGSAARTFSIADSTKTDTELNISAAISGTGGLIKTGTGALVLSGTNNTYSGDTVVSAGALRISSLSNLSSASNVQLNGGVIELSADVAIPSGTGPGQLQWTGSGGFSAYGGNRTITLAGGAAVAWAGSNFVPNASNLILSSTSSNSTITLTNDIDLAGATRTIAVGNGTAAIDAALSGVLSNGSISVTGAGVLALTGLNTFTSTIAIPANVTLAVTQLANGGSASSLGASSNAASNLLITNGTLQYVGTGSTTDRLLQIGTGSDTYATLVANGVSDSTHDGALVFSNTGSIGFTGSTSQARNLALEGSNTGNNTFTPSIGNNGTGITSVRKDDAGRWILAGANTYTGLTYIAAGTLAVTNASGLGGADFTSYTTVQDGATLELVNADVNNPLLIPERVIITGLGVNNAGALISNTAGVSRLTTGRVDIQGTASIGGTGSLEIFSQLSYTYSTDVLIKTGSGTLTLGGVVANDLRTTLVQAGTVVLDKRLGGDPNAYWWAISGANLGISSGAKVQIAGNTSDQIGYMTTVQVDAGGVLDFNGRNEAFNGLTGTGTVTNSAATASVLQIGSYSSFEDLGTSSTFSGVIQDGAGRMALTKAGTGTFTLNSANTYTGNTIVGQGSLVVANAAALGSTLNGTTVNNGATLTVSNTAVNAETITLNGTGVSGVGALTSTGTSSLAGNVILATDSTVGVTGTMAVNGNVSGNRKLTKIGTGTLALAGNNTYSGGTTITSGTVQVGTGGSTGNLGTGGVSNSGALVYNRTGTLTESNAISGTGTLTQAGTGTVILSNTSTYTGATSVNSGTLQVDGSIGNSAVTVANNATLASGTTGNIGNSVSVSSGGKLAAGGVGAVGTATVGTGGLALSSGSIFSWDLNGATGGLPTADQGTYDKVVSNGTLSGTSIFNVVLGTGDFTDTFWNTAHTWSDIFTGSGVPTDLAAIFTTFSGTSVNTDGSVTGQGGFTFNGSTTLTWSAVPEPTSAMAGLLLGAGLLRRRRKN